MTLARRIRGLEAAARGADSPMLFLLRIRGADGTGGEYVSAVSGGAKGGTIFRQPTETDGQFLARVHSETGNDPEPTGRIVIGGKQESGERQ